MVHIAELEERRAYAEIGYDGMYSYLTRGLGYSDGAAYRLQSARLLKQIPEVAEKIEEGKLNLSQLTQLQKCLKESEKKGEDVTSKKTLEVLEKLENKNSFETQQTLAVEMNLPVQSQEKVKSQANESVRIELTLSKEDFAELEKAKNLLSHICPDGSWSEVIATLVKTHNKKKLEGRKVSNPLVVSSRSEEHTSELQSH